MLGLAVRYLFPLLAEMLGDVFGLVFVGSSSLSFSP